MDDRYDGGTFTTKSLPHQDGYNNAHWFLLLLPEACSLQEEGGLPRVHTSDVFDPNAYKLMSLKQGLMGSMTSKK